MPDSNIPTVDLAAALDPASLEPWVDYQFADHAVHLVALSARFERFLEITKDGIHDDTTAGHASDFVKVLKAASTATDETRTKIKAPVLHAQRLIDGAGKKLTDKLKQHSDTVTVRITAFLHDKEARARLAAQIEAARLAHEAEAKLAEAQQSATIEAADAAVEAMQEADTAAALATAAPIELTRTRSVMGALTGLRDNWVHEVVDLSKVPAHLLTLNEAAVKLAIKQGVREIPGLRIWNDAKAYVR